MELRICNTHVSAGHTLTLKSGGDTTLDGAIASGNQVKADIGGNLNIASRQDTSTFDSQQHSAGFGVSIPIGNGNVSGSINASHANATGDYASVTEQSGIQAGDGGFQINVHGNTDLQGAVIASSEQAVQDHRNTLTTGSLTHSDIGNHDRYDAHSIGVGISMSGQSGSNGSNNQGTRTVGAGLTGTAVGVGSASGNAAGTTRSGISGGDITITDEPAQEARTGKDAAATVASIDRDVTTGDTSKTGALAKAWNGQQLLGDVMAQSQITAAFGQLAAKTIGDVADRKRNDAIARGDMAEAAKWDEGGEYRVALHAAAGALAGGVQGAAGAATSAAVMPTLGKLIDDLNAPKAVKQALAQVGAAALGGAVGGAAGLASAVNVEANNRQLHPEEKAFAKELAKRSNGKYTVEQIEAQLRLSDRVDINGNILEAGDASVINLLQQAPQDGSVVWQPVPGTTYVQEQMTAPNPDIIQFIQAQQTAMQNGVPYTAAVSFNRVPVYSTTPGMIDARVCATADCAAGMPRPMTAAELMERRNAAADVLSSIGTQVGRVGSTATAATAIPGPHEPIAGLISTGATIVGLGANFLEQVIRPNLGQMSVDFSANVVGEISNRIAPIASPITNEIIENMKSTPAVENIYNKINK